MRLSDKDKGFTILEVLIAMTLLSIGILGIAGLAGTAVRSSSYSQALTQGTNLAQERIETLQSVDFSNLQATDTTTARTDLRRTCTGPTGPVSRPVYSCTPTTTALPLGNKTFNWSYTVTYIDLNGDGTANPNSDKTKRLDITISWTDTLWHTTKSLSVVTIRSRG
jgi:type IV pilus modification protein PilV